MVSRIIPPVVSSLETVVAPGVTTLSRPRPCRGIRAVNPDESPLARGRPRPLTAFFVVTARGSTDGFRPAPTRGTVLGPLRGGRPGPDVIAIVPTLVAAGAALATGSGPLETLDAWSGGIWPLLASPVSSTTGDAVAKSHTTVAMLAGLVVCGWLPASLVVL